MDGRERSSVVHAHVRVMKVEAATSKRVNVNARMNASSLINYLLKFLSDWDLGQRTIVWPFYLFIPSRSPSYFAFQQNGTPLCPLPFVFFLFFLRSSINKLKINGNICKYVELKVTVCGIIGRICLLFFCF